MAENGKLERIRLRNFQCHELLDVRFDGKITAVIGDSDVGKSAIIRALRWVATNRPRGDSFIRDGEAGASVKVKIDGRTVERRRGKSGNTYLLSGNSLKSFGTDVPESVAELLNLGEENFSGQHDPPFWFSLTPGEVAKRLNRIVDLGLIDEVMGRVAARLRRAKAEEEVTRDRLGKAEVERDRLGYVPDLNRDLVDMEDTDNRRATLEARVSRLGTVCGEGIEYREAISRLLGAVLDGSTVLSVAGIALELGKRVDGLWELVGRVRDAEEAASVEIPDTAELLDAKSHLESLLDEADELGDFIGSVRKKVEEVAGGYNMLDEAKKSLDDATEGVCPLCGGELK